MKNDKKMAIIIAVLFFLAGTALNIDYTMWNEETYNEYQKSEPYICWSPYGEGNNCPEEMRTQIEYNDWKFYKDKSYWHDLADRLSVVAVVSAEEQKPDYKNDLNISNIENIIDMTQWYYITIASELGLGSDAIRTLTTSYYDDEGNEYKIALVKSNHAKRTKEDALATLKELEKIAQLKSTYKEEVNGTTYYYIRLTREQLDNLKKCEDINVSQYYSTTPPDEEFKWEVEEEYPTELEVNISDYHRKTLYIPIRECCEESEHFIIMRNHPYVSHTQYVMIKTSGWYYNSFKLPIYRRI